MICCNSYFLFFEIVCVCKCDVPRDNDQRDWWQKPPVDHLSWGGPVELRDPLLSQTCGRHSCSENILSHTVKDSGQAALTSNHQALEGYLENRPLKKVLTFTCGLGIIPAFRYRKSILLYLWRKQV